MAGVQRFLSRREGKRNHEREGHHHSNILSKKPPPSVVSLRPCLPDLMPFPFPRQWRISNASAFPYVLQLEIEMGLLYCLHHILPSSFFPSYTPILTASSVQSSPELISNPFDPNSPAHFYGLFDAHSPANQVEEQKVSLVPLPLTVANLTQVSRSGHCGSA